MNWRENDLKSTTGAVIHAKADIHMMEMEAPIFVAGKTGKAVRKGLMQLSLLTPLRSL